MAVTVETLRGELEEAFRNRAHLYRLLLEELEAELGPERAEARAGARRSSGAAARWRRACSPDLPADPHGDRRRASSSVSPDGGRLYPHDAECRDGAMAIRVHRCPLKEAWCEARLPTGAHRDPVPDRRRLRPRPVRGRGTDLHERDLERGPRRRLLLDPPRPARPLRLCGGVLYIRTLRSGRTEACFRASR